MDYSIRCECGHEIVVSEGAAGVRLPCDCGRIVDIPSLGALRKSIGLPAVDVPLEIEVWSRLESGELPPPQCVGCGKDAEPISYVAECEQVDELTSHDKWPLVQGLVFAMGLLANSLVFAYRINGQDETVTATLGREVNIPTPVRCCAACRDRFIRKPTNDILRKARTLLLWSGIISFLLFFYAIGAVAMAVGIGLQSFASYQHARYQRRVKDLLSGVPFYKRVFEKYPGAAVEVH
jgi:hypothetical protein